jgi:2-iminobutanoate/2-iminopropanoate deaminase
LCDSSKYNLSVSTQMIKHIGKVLTRAMSSNLVIIHSKTAAPPVGAYSQAVRAGPFVYTSGQIGIDTQLTLVDKDVKAQTLKAFYNLQEVLAAADCTVNDVIKCTIFIKDMNDFALVNDIYGTVFKDHKPARSCVEVARLPKDARVEIEAIAYKPLNSNL